MDRDQQRLRCRLRSCLEAVCEMENRLEEFGQAGPFKRDFLFLRGGMARTASMNCGEKDMQRLERTIQLLFEEFREMLEPEITGNFSAWSGSR